tara:strand:+ start:5170 stop:7566 length:2397 start_codon:yes stop_codon:yes gene_type:complete
MSNKILVIVESPGKIKKIEEYLGEDYIVKASYGHFLDLDPKELSIDVKNNFEPNYVVNSDKRNVVADLRSLAKQCQDVIIASDEDREGEKIGADLATVLKLKDPKRIVFHEITKKAILNAISNPGKINYNMVYAQQARRLLDRLVGYKISPILWSSMNGAKSAGRVQSIVVKIISTREDEINKSISEPYFKTTGSFIIKKNKTNANLCLSKSKELYKFDKYDNAKLWMNKIGENTTFKLAKINDKESQRKPSPPFITSTLQQDASSKLRYPVKKTMQIAQKLYEAGHITYMRTDSTNLSEDARKKAKEYIVKNYGEKYSNPTNYTKNSKNAQEAHEAIRPTKLDVSEITNMYPECIKLYNLIWKRTIASQMSHAQVLTKILSIDAINYPKMKSILPKKTFFKTSIETILFDGFLIVYNNKIKIEGVEDIDSPTECEINSKKKIKLKVDDKVKFKSIIISEEYTKPPLRYNEAGLIKFLEKNGIGRPSTYASIISKVIDRDYINIRNVEGIKKRSKILTLDKNFKLSENEKDISIGSEKNKLVSTEMGMKVNCFMNTNFKEIMDLKFTAKFEKYLDKIASGKAKWYNILQIYYDSFNPIVELLAQTNKELKDKGIHNEDIFLGNHPRENLPIYKGIGKHGPYIKILEESGSTKWKYSSVKEDDFKNLDLDSAVKILILPKYLGKVEKSMVYLCKGRYGYYLKMGASKNVSVKDTIDINTFSIEDAKGLINNQSDPYAIKSFKFKKKTLNIRNGKYGNYIMISGKRKRNVPIPKDVDIETLDLETVLGIITHHNKRYSNN